MLEGQADSQSDRRPAAGAMEECFVASALWHALCNVRWMVLPMADDKLNTHCLSQVDSAPTAFFASDFLCERTRLDEHELCHAARRI